MYKYGPWEHDFIFFFGTLTALMYRRPARVYIYILVLCVCALYTSATVYMYTQNDRKTRAVSARNGRLNARKAGEVFAPIFYFVVVVVVCVCLLTLSGVNYSLDTHTQKTGAAYMC